MATLLAPRDAPVSIRRSPMPELPIPSSPRAPALVVALPRFLRAFGSRNYRLFFGGQLVSLVGTWMTFTASLWLGYHLKSSALLLGVVGFSGQAPIFFLSPLAGGRIGVRWTMVSCVAKSWDGAGKL